MKDARGRRVLITGAASGIGLSTAEEFARCGSELILTDLNAEGLLEAKRRLGGRGIPVHVRQVDVADRLEVEATAAWVVGELGGLDILINNAGVGYQGELEETSLETWKKLLEVNLLGPLYHIYAFLPHFKEKRSGHIVNVSSGQAFFRLPTWGAYASVKTALGAFSEILHFELRRYDIRVTTVYPFLVNTRFYRDIHGRTWGSRMAMRLIPYYSMSPQKAARIICRAVRKDAKVEKVSFLNDLGFYAQVVPLAGDILARTSELLLAGTGKKKAA
ncbi:MAG: SDR family oxidoreductase [bacterium]